MHTNFSDYNQIINFLDEKNIKFVNFKFVDPFGVWQNLTVPSHQATKEIFENGLAFDGSSIRGWKSINESDMLLIPDVTTTFMDPFISEPAMSITCSVRDPKTKQDYSMDSRNIAKKVGQYLQSSGIADKIFFGPEAEFFIFDSVKYSVGANYSYYKVDSEEGAWNTGQDEHDMGGNLGYKINHKRGYFPVSPIDKTAEIRLDMIKTLEQVGITVEKGHHEVGSGGQGEINFKYDQLLVTADNLMKYKYVLRNVAFVHGRYLTFLPKPLSGDNGTGMHCHFSMAKDGKNIFTGQEYGGLSQIGLWAIGGIIKNAKAIAAFTNPTFNSYRRLVPGFEAPVNLVHSYTNRSAAIRIPYVSDPKQARIECRFPDASSNPYLAFSAISMAAIDGIKNQIQPRQPLDKDLYELSEAELGSYPKMPESLEDAVKHLQQENQFLLEGNVFCKEFVDVWAKAKLDEVEAIRQSINPKEFELYNDI